MILLDKEKRVLPGDFISTEEEFEAGNNAFESNGNIRSAAIGKVVENRLRKKVSVEADENVVPAVIGDSVYGIVVFVKDNSVRLDIIPEPSEKDRKVLTAYSASLPVRMVCRDYVERLKDFFKVGDIVKAKIASIHSDGIDIKTNEPELGVIKGLCTKCRKPLHLFGQTLKCLACGSTEERKISTEYMLK